MNSVHRDGTSQIRFAGIALGLALAHYLVWLFLAFVRWISISSHGAGPVPVWHEVLYGILSVPLFLVPSGWLIAFLERSDSEMLGLLAWAALNSALWGFTLAFFARVLTRRRVRKRAVHGRPAL